MAFTPLGYLRVGLVIEATLLMIPVAIGAIRLGPVAGGLLGGVFGLTSFAQCFGISPFGTILMGIDPLATFIVCMVPRVLMGISVGLIYRAVLPKDETEDDGRSLKVEPIRTHPFAMATAFFSSSVLNTVLFVGFFLVLFGSTDFVRDMQGSTPLLFFVASFVGINGIAEAIVATAGGTLIGTALERARLIM
jgi:uncharacterized membrane protein